MSERGGYGFSDEIKEQALWRCQKRCEYCGKEEVSEGPLREKANFKLEGHHIVPVHYARDYLANSQEVRDFISGPDNIEFVCPECHQKEHQHEDREFFQTVIENALGPEAFKKKIPLPPRPKKKKKQEREPTKKEIEIAERSEYVRNLKPHDYTRIKWPERTELEAAEIARIEQQIREFEPPEPVVIRPSHRRGETTIVEGKGNLWVRMWEVVRGMGGGRGEDWASLAADRANQAIERENSECPGSAQCPESRETE